MDIDVSAHLGAVTRRLEHRERDGRPTKIVVVERTFSTDAEDLWDAITAPERIPRWFLPISGEFRVGGRYQFEGQAGGEILVCNRPQHLGVTWEYGGEIGWVDVRLTPADGGTRLVLEHAGHYPDEVWAEYGPGAVGVGWDMAMIGLAEHVATGASFDPQEGAAWAQSPQGHEFTIGSSDAWCAASIAAGTPDADARAAADRTTAAYTGAEPAPTDG